MLVLAIDTALDACAACLAEADGAGRAPGVFRECATRSEQLDRGHAERLMDMVAEVMAGGGRSFEALDRIAVTVGPGSFTGIRVGLAAARGLALAAGVPVVGVTTLEALAVAAASGNDLSGEDDRPILAAIDARRGEVYAQLFAGAGPDGRPVPLGTAEALPILEAATLARARRAVLTGSGATLLAATEGPPLTAAPPGGAPPIAVVARLGALAPLPERPPGPLYLRAADAKPQQGFRVARAAPGAPA
jgi:tRNA threonylcarbamoyl adenosine modification protein YeaZ